MKYTIFIPVFLIISYCVSAQEIRNNDPFYLSENIASSPEASSLGRYGNIKASPYNGKANVSLPLYSIDFEGLKIPIQLNYDTGGVRVVQEASWVGLNWNLSTTHGISRKVYGIDDFSKRNANLYNTYNGYIYNPLVMGLLEGADRPYLDIDDILNVHESYGNTSVAGDGSSYLDTQPDVFNVSVLGQSYTFILEKKGTGDILQTKVFNSNNVKIIFDLLTMSFDLIDENGFKFHFETNEVNTNFSTVSENTPPTDYLESIALIFSRTHRANESIITTWLLDNVTSPRGRVLNFNYQKGLHFTFPDYSFDYNIRGNEALNGWPNEQYNSVSGQNTLIGHKANYNVSFTVIENNYLTSITGNFGSVEFHLENRLDLSTGSTINLLSQNNFGTKVLTTSQSGSIRSCHGTTTNCGTNTPYLPWKLSGFSVKNNSGKNVFNVDFGQSYFNSNEINSPIKERYLRLKLDTVTINDQIHSFEYSDVNLLPAKDSYAVDFWGFSNGKINNNTYNPSLGRFITKYINTPSGSTSAQSFMNFKGADRSSDFLYGKRGLLNKIVYPTKGSTVFEYEAHDVVLDTPPLFQVTQYVPNSQRMRWTDMTDESKFDITFQYLKCSKDSNYNYFEREGTLEQGSPIIIPVVINEVFEVSFPSLIQISGSINTYTGWNGIGYWGNRPILVVEEINNGQEYVVFTYGDAPSNQGSPPNNVSKSISIPPGEFRIVRRWATLPAGEDYNNYPPIPASYFQPNSLLVKTYENINNISAFFERFEVGGARIKKIINKDANALFASGKEYKYNYTGAIAGLSSSGVLMDDLIYHNSGAGLHSFNPSGYNFSFKGYNMVGGNTSAQGSHIGYSFVQEFPINNLNNQLGHVDRTYHNLKNKYFKDSFCFPFMYDGITNDNYGTIHIFGFDTGWSCFGGGGMFDCDDGTGGKVYSRTGDACVENTVVLGLPTRLDYSYINGSIIKESTYNQNQNLLKKTENSYALLKGDVPLDYFTSFMNIGIHGIIGQNGGVAATLLNTTQGPWGADHHTYFPYLFPLHHGLVSKLSNSIKTEFMNSGDVVSESILIYNNITHLPTISTSLLNETEEVSNRLFYPNDSEVYGKPFMSNLRAENRLATVIKANSYKENNKLSTLEYSYAKNVNTANITLVTSISKSKGEATLKEDVIYEKYDNKGNLLQYRQKDGTPIIYIWGYNEQYPIVKIENAVYAQVSGQVINIQNKSNLDDDNCTDAENCDEKNLRTALNSLRLSLPLAMVTTYTYDPLVGLTSMTDPKGYTVYYDYDAFNRLRQAKDADGKILSETEYHYRQ
ncbi:RHS repeat protein [Subsaximicrobium wynnwilliamsii]|uniref:RHS repeat protein n=1 Tax=Subsaximicrobium wynnwilliamsii TaxID=291179 RepID=A0A5C6ZH34_9FLAO|nr:RHS repeat domain-containing protein [Subsaximicrobium wynnwilliamsii]TXD83440.1 RHS repeat protein [Subsaximicrobium wynnwilliamsii]TXD89285.1 RHS repeat protein [Subsaximicrobium wynnwilliamsii]TXE03120.1 RHS repeat protein [Subsaximicrobium wynnwilliamsii]